MYNIVHYVITDVNVVPQHDKQSKERLGNTQCGTQENL